MIQFKRPATILLAGIFLTIYIQAVDGRRAAVARKRRMYHNIREEVKDSPTIVEYLTFLFLYSSSVVTVNVPPLDFEAEADNIYHTGEDNSLN